MELLFGHIIIKSTKTKAKIENTFISSLNDLFDYLNKDFKISKPTNINMKFIDSDPELTSQEIVKKKLIN